MWKRSSLHSIRLLHDHFYGGIKKRAQRELVTSNQFSCQVDFRNQEIGSRALQTCEAFTAKISDRRASVKSQHV